MISRLALILPMVVACSPALAQRPAPQPRPQPQPQPSMQAVAFAEQAQIVTQATGRAKAAPDRATLMISVQTRAGTAEAAASQNATRQRAVIDALRAAGLSQDQISTTGYSVHPDMRYSEDREPRILGYVVTNTVRADIREMERVGRAIDAALGAGANMISSLTFSSSRADSARREALGEAVRLARQEAEAIAAAAGGRIVGPLEISTAGLMPPQPRYAMQERAAMADASAPTPIEPGAQEITAFVTARWHFEPSR